MDKSKDTVTVDRLGRAIQNLARAPLLLDAINVNINSIFAVVMRVRVDVTVATCCSSWSPKHFSIRVPETSCNMVALRLLLSGHSEGQSDLGRRCQIEFAPVSSHSCALFC
eukprot:m.78615 g.78615  ORF g.78615 m.78615 type:complete len:111 (-) comp10725_c1_seq1:216-548(-)